MAVANIGRKIFTPKYIEEMRSPRFKRQAEDYSATTFGYMHPCIPCGVNGAIDLDPAKQKFRVMDWGPGFDPQFWRRAIHGTVEPLEIMGYFLARGKAATVECFDLQPMTRYASHLYGSYCGLNALRKIAGGFGVSVKDDHSYDAIITQDISPEKFNGISFHNADIMNIEEMDRAPYDLIFILNVFNYLSDLSPETKDNVFYHAIRLLSPTGILVFNDYERPAVPDWISHFERRIDDLGLYGRILRYGGERQSGLSFFVFKNKPPREWDFRS